MHLIYSVFCRPSHFLFRLRFSLPPPPGPNPHASPSRPPLDSLARSSRHDIQLIFRPALANVFQPFVGTSGSTEKKNDCRINPLETLDRGAQWQKKAKEGQPWVLFPCAAPAALPPLVTCHSSLVTARPPAPRLFVASLLSSRRCLRFPLVFSSAQGALPFCIA